MNETNGYVSKRANWQVKFCFVDSHGNMKIKFSDTKNASFRRDIDETEWSLATGNADVNLSFEIFLRLIES